MTRERIELILFLVCSRSKSEMKVKCQNIHIFLPLFLLLLVDYVLYVGNTRYDPKRLQSDIFNLSLFYFVEKSELKCIKT